MLKSIKACIVIILFSCIVQTNAVSALNANNEASWVYAFNPFVVENRGSFSKLQKFTAVNSGMYTLLVNPNSDLNEESYSTVRIYPTSLRVNPIAQGMAYNNKFSFYMNGGETVYIEISPVISSIAVITKNSSYQLKNGWDIFEKTKSKIIEYSPSETRAYYFKFGSYGGLGSYSNNVNVSISSDKNFEDIIESGTEISAFLEKNIKYFIKVEDLNDYYNYLSGRLDISTDSGDNKLIEEIPTDISVTKGKYKEFSFTPNEYGMYAFSTDYYGGNIKDSQMDTEIMLYDKDHKLIVANSDKVDQENVFSEIIRSLSPKEKYYFRVEGYGKRAVDVRVLVTYIEDEDDPSPPKIILSKEGWSNEEVTFNLLHGVDTGSGVDLSYVSIDDGALLPFSSPKTINKEGITKIRALSVDYWGNTSSSVVAEIKIDFTPPSSPIIFLSPGSKKNKRMTLVDGKDQLSGILRTEYKLGADGDWKTYMEPVEIVNGTFNSVFVRSLDNAGNMSNIISKSLKSKYYYEYDNNGRLTATREGESKKVIYKYFYDKNGNLLRIDKMN